MIESGKRRPSLETLEKIAIALGIPFHLFTLLASEPQDIRDTDPEAINRLAEDSASCCWAEEGMTAEELAPVVEKLHILSVSRLADLLSVPRKTFVTLSVSPGLNYDPFEATRRLRPFQKAPRPKPRRIDNPLSELRWVQKRIHRRLLKPICFPEHILGAVPSAACETTQSGT